MRGEHYKANEHGMEFYGIIPACAGSTSRAFDGRYYVQGSSPHARGARSSARP